MKNGLYRISLEVELTGMEDREEAIQHVVQMLKDLEDEDKFPDLEMTLLEEYEDDEEAESEGDCLDEMHA